MNIKKGGYYYTRSGTRVGPITFPGDGLAQGWGGGRYLSFDSASGKHKYGTTELDLVEEAQHNSLPHKLVKKPMVTEKTVIVKQVNPGIYGKLKVCASTSSTVTLQIGGTKFNKADLALLRDQIKQLMDCIND